MVVINAVHRQSGSVERRLDGDEAVFVSSFGKAIVVITCKVSKVMTGGQCTKDIEDTWEEVPIVLYPRIAAVSSCCSRGSLLFVAPPFV